MKEKIEFRQIREFGDIIGDTFVFIKQNFKPLMKAFFVLCGMFVLGGIITSIVTQMELKDVTSNFYNGNYSKQSHRWTSSFLLKYLTVFGFFWLNLTAFYATVLSYVALYIVKEKEAPNVEEVWSYFRFYFFRVLLSNLVVGVLLMLGFVFCLVPGFYLFPAMTIFFPVMVLENRTFSFSFNRSFKLIRDNWWITAATLLVIYIITYAFTTIVQLPALLLMMVAEITHGEKPISDVYVYATAITQNIAYVFYIIPIVASALVYYNLIERKESVGLLERMNNLGQQKQEDILPEEY